MAYNNEKHLMLKNNHKLIEWEVKIGIQNSNENLVQVGFICTLRKMASI